MQNGELEVKEKPSQGKTNVLYSITLRISEDIALPDSGGHPSRIRGEDVVM